jgi:Protein of unknown function (DUF1698)
MMRESILDQYITSAPSEQNALDIFKTEWASMFPGDWATLQAGNLPLFEDERIRWAIEQLGGVQGQSLLELGPLEAAHTYMLEQAGASSITAIESNTRAYLKCLIVKEIMKLQRSHFLCGNFIEYLQHSLKKFDACVASGVLYHMQNPSELIQLIAKTANRVFIWTHYFDHDIIAGDPSLAIKFDLDGISADYQGFEHRLYRQEYQSALNFQGFCGGSQPFSYWMSRDDLLACLKFFGFNDLTISFESPNHPNGPSLALLASRTDT